MLSNLTRDRLLDRHHDANHEQQAAADAFAGDNGDDDGKRIQIARAGRASLRARRVKLADKICDLEDIVARLPADWSVERRRQYFDWARSVVDEVRGMNRAVERRFDPLYRQRPWRRLQQRSEQIAKIRPLVRTVIN